MLPFLLFFRILYPPTPLPPPPFLRSDFSGNVGQSFLPLSFVPSLSLFLFFLTLFDGLSISHPRNACKFSTAPPLVYDRRGFLPQKPPGIPSHRLSPFRPPQESPLGGGCVFSSSTPFPPPIEVPPSHPPLLTHPRSTTPPEDPVGPFFLPPPM